jgi:hypothetical protein
VKRFALPALLAIVSGTALVAVVRASQNAASSEQESGAPSAAPRSVTASARPKQGARSAAADEGTTSDPKRPRDATAASDAPLRELSRGIAALDRAPWDDIAAAFLRPATKDRFVVSLRALEVDLAGVVPTAAGSGRPGELTHPAVIARSLGEVLARGDRPLTSEQVAALSALVEQTEGALRRALADRASRPRLASLGDEVEIKLDLVERIGRLLAPEQRVVFDRMTIADADGMSPLSPVRLVEVHEVDVGADAHAWSEDLAASFARSFQIELPRARGLTDALVSELAPLLRPSSPELSAAERVRLAMRAQARTVEDLIRLPDLTPEARQRALHVTRVLVPRAVDPKSR